MKSRKIVGFQYSYLQFSHRVRMQIIVFFLSISVVYQLVKSNFWQFFYFLISAKLLNISDILNLQPLIGNRFSCNVSNIKTYIL